MKKKIGEIYNKTKNKQRMSNILSGVQIDYKN